MNYLSKLPKGKRNRSFKRREDFVVQLRRTFKKSFFELIELPMENTKSLTFHLQNLVDGQDTIVRSLYGGDYYTVHSDELTKLKKEIQKYYRYVAVVKSYKDREATIVYDKLNYATQYYHLFQKFRVNKVSINLNYTERNKELDNCLTKFKTQMKKINITVNEPT
jgi:hypothetical protein